MNRTIKNKFEGKTADETASEFAQYIGVDNAWFMKFVFALKEDWLNKGCSVSDILIREGKPIMVAPVKTYVPFVAKNFEITFTPTRTGINDIAKKFHHFSGEQKEGVVAEFSFYVMGLGIFRVNYSFDSGGVGMSIRYLTFNLPELGNRKYPPFYENFIRKLVSTSSIKTPTGVVKTNTIRNGGLILHVGATGSGKTTSIASEVGHFAENITGAIVTYENPIEYRYTAMKAPVRQYEIGIDIKKTDELTEFESIKRHLLRNNPSVVVIGEARDKNEIKEMLDASARGHLVFGTIHASNVMEALTLLMSITADEPYLLASVLQAIVAHRLTTNKEGELIPIYEILIPDTIIRTHLSAGNLKEIGSIFIKENLQKLAITFTNSINNLVSEGVLTPEEGRKAGVASSE